jgi:membrane protein YqaA with SNARE-associated domain
MSAMMVYGLGIKYAYIFVAAAVFGTIFEWFFGFYYYRITGEKLWRYRRYNLNEYVSALTLPAWGFAGMLFAFLGQLILGR